MEDLVRPRAADPRDHALVAEQRVQAPRFAREDVGQLSRVDLVCLRPEVTELELDGVRRERPTPARFSFPASVRISSAPPSNAILNAGVSGRFSPRARTAGALPVIR